MLCRMCPFHYVTKRGHEVTALRGDKDQTSHRHHGGSRIKLAGVLRGLLFRIMGMVNTFPWDRDSDPSLALGLGSGYP